MRSRKQSIFAAAVTVLLFGCNAGGGSNDDNGTNDQDAASSASGSIQKGPFQMGQTVTATRLTDDGGLSSDTATTETGERGAFEFDGLSWAGATQLSIQGTYFDEVAGNFSGTDRTLLGVARLEDGQTLSTYVNLYTHFITKRVRFLMGQGTGFDAGLDQARTELQTAFDIDTAPGELNLLKAIESTSEEDSANLLMFSAAVLKAGIDQTGLDAMADDFADDGAINGAGVDELNEINAQQDATLFSDARLALKNQYSVEPPDTSQSDFGWVLDECALAKLNESRPVVCTETDSSGTVSRTNEAGETRMTAVVVTQAAGHYWLETVTSGDNSAVSTSWALSSDRDADTAYRCDGYGTSDASGGSYAEGPTSRLSDNRAYCMEIYASPAFGSGGPETINLHWFKISEGRESAASAAPVPLNQDYEATVGNHINNDTIYSYYQFDIDQSGEHRIVADDFYNGGGGTLKLTLYGDADDNGNTTFDSADELVTEWGTTSGTEIIRSLPAGTYLLKVQNDTDRTTGLNDSVDSNPTDFRIRIEPTS